MYKKQMGFQRIVCLVAIIAAAIWFVYSLGMITDIHDALRYTMRNPNDLTDSKVAGSILYYDMQPFNKAFLYASIGMILVGCLLFVTNTHTRRRYYIGNFTATGLYCLASVALVIWSHINIDAFTTQFLTTVDFEALKKQSEMFKNIVYTESTFLLDLHLAVAGISLLAVAGLAVNTVWKIRMMREEARLIEAGKEARV